jgi:Na+-driven multidrug efflux pump
MPTKIAPQRRADRPARTSLCAGWAVEEGRGGGGGGEEANNKLMSLLLWRRIRRRAKSKNAEHLAPTQPSPPPPADAAALAAAIATVPSFRQLMLYCLGPVIIWLSEPLLSLVDTYTVRHSLNQLAAMGPATTLMDLTLYATYFLALTATSRIAHAEASCDYRQCQQVTSHLTSVALVTGLALTALLWSPALPWMLHRSMHVGPTLTPLAARYCAVRAVSAPLAVLGMVAQAVCLATHNVSAPVVAVGLASLVNVVGDTCLRRYGMVGVATATAMASTAACAVLMQSVLQTMNRWRELEQTQPKREQRMGTESTIDVSLLLQNMDDTVRSDGKKKLDERALLTMTQRVNHTTATILSSETQLLRPDTAITIADEGSEEATLYSAWKDTSTVTESVLMPPIPYVSFPDRHSLREYVLLSLPLAFNMWAKMACYFVLTVKAADFGSTALAAHNILMRVFFFFASLADSLGQAAQTYIPSTLYPTFNQQSCTVLLQRLGVLAVGAAVLNYTASRALLQQCASIFTTNAAILTHLNDASVWTALALAMHPIVVTISGTVLATRNFRNLAKVYAITLVSHFTILHRAVSFVHVWHALVAFQLVRLGNYLFWSKVTPRKP